MEAAAQAMGLLNQALAYILWIWAAVLVLAALVVLGWADPLDPYFTRVNAYMAGWARSLRIQYEASLKFALLVVLY